ncbi:MAG: C25 family cysteine peptidase [Euryarchaeota archaeon]|nr:C25 family cysteine peptidase [Euryarchaeota archaeon]
MRGRTETKKLSIGYIAVALLILSPCFYEGIVHATDQENILTYSIFFEYPQITEKTLYGKTFTQIDIQDCISQATPGNPVLPVKSVQILIPSGKTISHIDVSYREYLKIDCNVLENPIIPQQEPTTTEPNEDTEPFLINETIYNSTTPVFDSIYTDDGVGFCRGFTIFTVYLYPVKYIPKTGKLYYFPEMTITITLEENIQSLSDESQMMNRVDEEDITVIESMVINPEIIPPYFPPSYSMLEISNGLCDPAASYQYIIITNNALNNTIGQEYNFSDLLSHRTSYSGLTTNIVTVETIDACAAYWNTTALFNDSAAHIREFIKDAYQNWETQYVVLGGDWDVSTPSKQIVPVRMFTEYNSYLNDDQYYDMPCDLYYSNLDGDWRDTTHNCWGGGRNSGVNDPYAEVYVGRMTVSNAEELSNFIKKIIWYDLYADIAFLNTSVFFGGNLGAQFDVTSADYLEELRLGTDPNFYQCSGFDEWNQINPEHPFNISTTVYYNDGASIPADYQTVINANNACIINHLGHGNTVIALDMTIAQLQSLSNSKYFFSYSQQCLSGRFTAGDTPEKIVTSFSVSNGAFGLIWNSGYGWASSTDTNGPNQFLQRFFWDYFFTATEDNWQIGKAQVSAKDELSAYVDISGWHYAWCYNWYSSQLFGDPAQTLKANVSAPPTGIMTSDEYPAHEETDVSPGVISLQISVIDYEGDLMNITFQTNASGSWEDIGINNSQPDGIYSQLFSFPNYQTTYYWSVNITDITGNSGWYNETYQFTTRAIHTISPPESILATTYNKTQINLSWAKGSNATHTIIERNTTQCWIQGDGTLVYNGTNTNVVDTKLSFNTTYFYQAWGWDSFDSLCSDTFSESYNTTNLSWLPTITVNTPGNGSTGISVGTTLLSVTITDRDEDLLNWTITTAPAIGENTAINDSGGIKTCDIFNVAYSTTYSWFVNVKESGSENWTNVSYSFTTEQEPQQQYFGGGNPPVEPPVDPNTPPNTPAAPTGTTTGYIDTNYTYSTNATDPNIDQIQYRFDWDDGNISEWTSLVPSGTFFSMSHQWSSIGVYHVVACARDEHNIESNWSFALTVTIEVVPSTSEDDGEIEIQIPDNIIVDNDTPFNGTIITDTENNDLIYQWDFGDGTTGIGKQPNHAYSSPGIYNITLTIYDGNIILQSKTMQITVSAHPTTTENEQDDYSIFFPLFGIGAVGFVVVLLMVLYLHRKSLHNVSKKQ